MVKESRIQLKLEALKAAREVLADQESTSQARVAAASLIAKIADEFPQHEGLEDMSSEDLKRAISARRQQ